MERMDELDALLVEASELRAPSPRLATVLKMLGTPSSESRAAFARFLAGEMRPARSYERLVTLCGGVIPVNRFLRGGREGQWGVVVPKLGTAFVWYEAMVVSSHGWVRSTRCEGSDDALDVLVRDGFINLEPPGSLKHLRYLLDAWRSSPSDHSAFVPLQRSGKCGFEFRAC